MRWLLYLFVPIMLIASPRDELLQIFGQQPDEIFKTQELWLQKGKERWEFEARYEYLRPQVWPLFEQMGLFDEIKPTKKHYTYAIVLGALLNRVQDRVNYLSQLDVTYDHLIFLSGARPLLEVEKKTLPQLQTEAEMVQWVYQNSDLPKDVPVLFIDVPMNGKRRPQTVDTIMAWLERNPTTGSCLAISNQPYVHYHEAVFKRFVPFEAEVVGPAVLENPTVDLILDTLAKEYFWRFGVNKIPFPL